MLGFAGWYDSHDGYTTFMFYFPFNAYLLAGPLMYFYFLSLTNADFRLSRKHWPHLVLPMFFVALIIGKFMLDFCFYHPFPLTADYQFGTRGPYAEADKSLVVTLLGFASFFVYLYLSLKAFPAYRQYVRENFADPDDLYFNWLRQILFAVSLGVLILFGFKLCELLQGGISYKTDWFGYAALAVLSYYIAQKGYYIHTRQRFHLNFNAAAPAAEIEKKTEPNDPGDDAWLDAIAQLMQTTRLYLQPELSLTELAARLNTNKSVISRVINNNYQHNFNDFINRYRIEEVVEQIRKNKHHELTLLGIAYDCGFNSKATFNRAFKKVTGQTPSEFISEQESIST